MTSGFSTAANWLQHISGQNPKDALNKSTKDNADPILRDLRSITDLETQTKMDAKNQNLPSHESIPRNDSQKVVRGQFQQQPKPKFVAHKDPTRGRKGKDKVVSNRLGNELHMA